MDFKTVGERWAPQALGLLRIMAGLLFVEHGTGKLFHFPHFPMYDQVTLQSLPGAAGVIELVGGSLLTVGLFTRYAAFLMSGEMAIAYFLFHNPRSFYPLLNGGEPAILFCFIFLYMAAAGGGAWTLDGMMGRKAASPLEQG